MAVLIVAVVLPGWMGPEGQGQGSHWSWTVSLFDEGFALPPEPSLTQNSLELGKELPSCPCSLRLPVLG